MGRFEWDPDYVPGLKLGLHCAQIVLSFAVWCLEIAVFADKDSRIVGDNAWTFSVCFTSILAWLYLILTPRFARTRRFANANAMLLVDAIFTTFWLSAFATQAAYNSANLCGQACKLSKAIVGLGVFTTLLFLATTLISAYTLQFYKFHGTLPGYDSRQIRVPDSANIDPDKAAFSMAPHDDEYERVNMDDHESGGLGYSAPARYGSANPYSSADQDDEDPNRYGALPARNNDRFNVNTEYTPGDPNPPDSYPYSGAMHNSYNDEPVRFPAANYDRVQS